jgi:small subunit ribosomal protein S5
MRVVGQQIARASRLSARGAAPSTQGHSAAWQLHRFYTTETPSAPPAQAASDTANPSPSGQSPVAEATSTPTNTETATTSRFAESATAGDGVSKPLAPRRKKVGRAQRLPETPLPQYFPSKGFPNLIEPDALMDASETMTWYPEKGSKLRYPATVIIRNDPSMFEIDREQERQRKKAAGEAPVDELAKAEADLAAILDEGISPAPALRRFASQTGVASHMYMLLFRRVVNQTPKGRRPRFATLTCVGNGAGLVGYGEGKDDDPARSQELAYLQALRNMDRVERFEQRTVFTELRTKLGATQVIIRPRPVGFGLRTNPYIHQILKAAGIKDASAKVWGSRNPLNVIKATFRTLWAGHAPQGMGDGIGGPAKKLEKGSGVRTREEVERDRGRRLIDLRT